MNEDKEQQDLERETKMNIGMQKFMMQENDYRTLTDLIDESESKFNDLGGDIGMFRIVRVILTIQNIFKIKRKFAISNNLKFDETIRSKFSEN